MSIFLGFQNLDGKAVSPVLEAKGINLLRAEPRQVSVTAVLERVQPAYAAYIKCIPAFIRALETQTKTDTAMAYYPIKFPVDRCFPNTLPSLSVHFDQPLPAGTIEQFRTFGYSEQLHQKKNILIFPSLNRDQARIIKDAGARQNTPSPSGTCNLSSLQCWTLVVRVLSAFLKVHTYPAYRDLDHLASFGDDKFEGRDVVSKRTVTRAEPPRKRTRTDTDDATMAVEEPEEEADEETIETTTTIKPSDVLNVAQPPKPDAIGWGSVEMLPICDGIYIPFIPELANRDKKMVPFVFREYFLGCLGSNHEQVKATMSLIDSAFGVLTNTEAGDILAHLCKCIDIAIHGQAQCYPIFEEGKYEGCAILGAGVTYINGKNSVKPVPSNELRKIIEGFGTHRSTIAAIVKITGLDVEEDFLLDGEEITSMMQLSLWLKDVPLTEQKKDDIIRLSARLSFGKSWDFNSSSICRALALMSDTDDLPEDLPIHHSQLFVSDRDAVVLSCFGYLVPSPAYPSATSYNLGKPARPNSIHFHQVLHAQAVQDYRNINLSACVTVPNRARRSVPYRDREFKGEDKSRIFTALTIYAGVMLPVANEAQVVGGAGNAGNDEGLFDL